MIVLQTLWALWWAGIFASLVILWWRAGLTKGHTGVDWREFLLSNLGWFAVYWLLKSAAWPVVLYQWNAAGRPASPWQAVTEINGRPARRVVRVASLPPARV
jgi:hypothetical protein